MSKLSAEELAEIKDALKGQIIQEMQDERTRKMEESRIAREEQKKRYSQYVEEMKASSEPWVDVTGWSETDQGVKVELDWNDAFVDYLKGAGVTGTDDEQIVQKWVTLLLRDMADQIDGNREEGEYE